MASAELALGSRQIYVLPTRHGLLFGLVLVALLVAAINYSNSLVYLLTFSLAGMAVVSILHTQRNLLGLRLTVTGADPVFAGDNAQFQVCVANAGPMRTAVRIESGTLRSAWFDIPARDTRCIPLALAAPRRGYLDFPPVVLATHYPVGLSRAWTRRLALASRCLVYPRPADRADPSPGTAIDGEDGGGVQPGGDDFTGLRAYQPGDTPARIHWKSLAQGKGLHTKEFGAPIAESLMLDWDSFPVADPEERLSLLTRAVLDAEAAGLRYGLRLPTLEILPDLGALHRDRCLESLALYGLDPQG